jgi:hypothetical protein
MITSKRLLLTFQPRATREIITSYNVIHYSATNTTGQAQWQRAFAVLNIWGIAGFPI